jgi:hypothetical protein
LLDAIRCSSRSLQLNLQVAQWPFLRQGGGKGGVVCKRGSSEPLSFNMTSSSPCCNKPYRKASRKTRRLKNGDNFCASKRALAPLILGHSSLYLARLDRYLSALFPSPGQDSGAFPRCSHSLLHYQIQHVQREKPILLTSGEIA